MNGVLRDSSPQRVPSVPQGASALSTSLGHSNVYSSRVPTHASSAGLANGTAAGAGTRGHNSSATMSHSGSSARRGDDGVGGTASSTAVGRSMSSTFVTHAGSRSQVGDGHLESYKSLGRHHSNGGSNGGGTTTTTTRLVHGTGSGTDGGTFNRSSTSSRAGSTVSFHATDPSTSVSQPATTRTVTTRKFSYSKQ